MRSSLAAARAAAQDGGGGASSLMNGTVSEANIDAVLQQQLERLEQQRAQQVCRVY